MSFRVGSRGAVEGSAPGSRRRGLGSTAMSISGSRVGSTSLPSRGESWPGVFLGWRGSPSPPWQDIKGLRG